MPKRSSTGRLDLNQLAKRIVNEATGEEPKTKPPSVKNGAAALEKLGGKKDGVARPVTLTTERKSEIAKKTKYKSKDKS